MALSAIGFLFGFLNRPNSKEMFLSSQGWLLHKDLKPSEGSDLIVPFGPFGGCSGKMRVVNPSRRSSAFSDLMKVAAV